jgi:hypothetical protein
LLLRQSLPIRRRKQRHKKQSNTLPVTEAHRVRSPTANEMPALIEKFEVTAFEGVEGLPLRIDPKQLIEN